MKLSMVLMLMVMAGTCLGAGPSGQVRAAPTGTESELQTTVQRRANTKGTLDDLKRRLLEGVHKTAEYKQALAATKEAQAELAKAKASVPFSQDEVAAIAGTILRDENALEKIERPALDASEEWQAASAILRADNDSLHIVQQAQAKSQQEGVRRVLLQREADEKARAVAVVEEPQQPEPLTAEQQAKRDHDEAEAVKQRDEQQQYDQQRRDEEYARQQQANDDYNRQVREDAAAQQRYYDDMDAQRKAAEQQQCEIEQRMREANGG